ncbi:hypothetical protein C3L33_22746, partial [Rhododendron williamsianum]
VERERTLLNSKLLEFESLLRNPYVVPLANATRSVFPGATQSVSSLNAQNSTPPPVSSFSQLGASLNTGLATPSENAFHSAENSSQTTSVFGTNNSPFGTTGATLSSASIQSPILSKMLNSAPTAIGQLSENVDLSDNMPKQNGAVDDNIWLKEEWISGEIPEEAPPDRYIF